jgi:hypothetical protein
MAIDEQRLDAFLGKAVMDLGAAVSAVLIQLGDELGLYRELAKGPLNAAELASRTSTHERYRHCALRIRMDPSIFRAPTRSWRTCSISKSAPGTTSAPARVWSGASRCGRRPQCAI